MLLTLSNMRLLPRKIATPSQLPSYFLDTRTDSFLEIRNTVPKNNKQLQPGSKALTCAQMLHALKLLSSPPYAVSFHLSNVLPKHDGNLDITLIMHTSHTFSRKSEREKAQIDVLQTHRVPRHKNAPSCEPRETKMKTPCSANSQSAAVFETIFKCHYHVIAVIG